MDLEQTIKFLEEEIRELKKNQKELEFRQDLIFNTSPSNRILYEYKITAEQYGKIMDLMDSYRKKISNNEKVSHGSFEQQVYELVPQLKDNYHFVEYLLGAFKEENRWEEVFDVLYEDNPKYQG